MTIDIHKIIKINKLSHLKNYVIDAPIYNSNYLFHYLILANNLKGLKLTNFPVNKVNSDNYNGFMLAAKEGRYNILNYLLEHYPQFIYDKNILNMNFLHYLDVNSTDYINLLSHNLDWIKLYQTYSTKHISPLDILFRDGKYDIIKKIITKIKYIDYSKYIQQPVTFNLFINKHIRSSNIIKILEILYRDPKIFTYVDDMGYNIAFPIVLINKKNLIHYIVKRCGVTLNQYTPISTSHIFIVSYKLALKTNNYSNALYILKNVVNVNNNHCVYCSETDSHGDNLIHFILKSRILHKKGSAAIEHMLLSKYTLWTKRNLDKVSPLDLITSLDYDKYHKYVKSLDTNNYSDYSNLKWRKYINKLPKQKTSDNIKMIKSPYTHANMFQSRFTDTAIFCFYLREKYKNLYLPIYEGKYKANLNEDFKLPDDMLTEYNNFPWLIVWNSPTKYWVHPKLNELINTNKTKYKYAFVILSLRLPHDGLHATLILYDFKRKLIERFDPYGNTTILDPLMDNILKARLTKDLDFTYISPSVYFPVSGFQTLSDENNNMNQKMGDFGGYCLAWCFWYVEHRLLNSKANPSDLIRKTLNKFMNMKIKPMEYIRNYGNMISQYRLEYFKKIGLGEHIGSNENLTDNEQDILFNSIIKYNLKID